MNLNCLIIDDESFFQIIPKYYIQTKNMDNKFIYKQYILETDDQYPKKICFMVWSDKIDELAIKQGENLSVSIDIESREYNGRWYTDVKAWKVTRDSVSADNIPFAEPEDFNNTQSEEPPLLDDEIPF